jgi:hypothetical protein
MRSKSLWQWYIDTNIMFLSETLSCCIDYAQLSRFYLKMETESSPWNIVFLNRNRMIMCRNMFVLLYHHHTLLDLIIQKVRILRTERNGSLAVVTEKILDLGINIFQPIFFQRAMLISRQYRQSNASVNLFSGHISPTFSDCKVSHLYHSWKSLDVPTCWYL